MSGDTDKLQAISTSHFLSSPNQYHSNMRDQARRFNAAIAERRCLAGHVMNIPKRKALLEVNFEIS
jgi:hypothetical protein